MNSVPQTAATTFAFPSVFILLRYCHSTKLLEWNTHLQGDGGNCGCPCRGYTVPKCDLEYVEQCYQARGGSATHFTAALVAVIAEEKHLKIFAVLYTVTVFGIATIACTVRVDLLCKTNLLNSFFYSAPFLPNLICKVHNLPS